MPATLHALWQRTAKAKPNAPALLDAAANRTWTRAELAELGAGWARAHGVDLRGQRVVFAEPNGAEWLRVFLGVQACGATAIALDPGEPLAALRAVAARAGAAFLWRDGKLETLSAGRRVPGGRACLLKVTSGSTGVPKTLPFTDEQMIADGRQVCATMGIKATDINLGCIPFGHSYGLGNLVLPLLLQGTAIVSGADVLPHALAAAIATWLPPVFPAVPTLLRGWAEAEIPPRQLRSLRMVISAGAPLAPEIAQALKRKFDLPVHNFYGSSETGGIAYDRTGTAALTGRSVGRPMKGVTLTFAQSGRFFVASAAVGGRGRFSPADRGELNARDELVLLGRSGRMVKIGGRRLDPAEVERALRGMPGVADAVVELNPQRADSLVAVVASRCLPAAVKDFLQGQIASWKIPRRILAIPAFPTTARGKTDMRQLRELLHGVPRVS
ncbi:MAG: hypothetical protein JWM35_2300 [Verrucomicrobia bacterium]|nr:hypothetical protein [Verrucomicrobiota bacterium]